MTPGAVLGAASSFLLTVLLTACATSETSAAGAAPTVASDRGHDLARRQCSTCHAIDLTGESRWPSAPPFRDIRVRYNGISFERRMREIAERGHYEMTPLSVDPADVRDLSAYIESLERN